MARKGGAPENMRPAKKGEVRNPKGRPKGSLNRTTLIKKWIEVSESIKNPITGKMQQLTQADIMTLALIKKARQGDVQAFRELMDGAFGKITEQVDHTSGGEKIEMPILPVSVK